MFSIVSDYGYEYELTKKNKTGFKILKQRKIWTTTDMFVMYVLFDIFKPA